MKSPEPDPFYELSEAFHRWSTLPKPTGEIRDTHAPTYQIDAALDHEVSSLWSVGASALVRDTKVDWANIVSEYLADLDTVARSVSSASIPDELKRKYQEYISECQLVWEKVRLLPVPIEGHLGFCTYVLEKFRFLETLYGFRVTDTSPTKVRFESQELFVELSYFPGAPELSFELGKLGEEQQRFSLDDIAHWAGLGLRFDYASFELETRDGLASFIAAVAGFTEKYAAPLLRNDSCSFDALLEKQSERERLIADSES